jgi:Ca2+ transporting ATPase
VQPLTAAKREAILAEVRSMGSNESALRCLGFAFVTTQAADKLQASDPSHFAKLESKMTFCGVAGMLDPPRIEVRDAIHDCATAGIRVIVITGDNKDTAIAICRKIGIFADGEDANAMSFTGDEFDRMTLEEKRRSVHVARLFARTDPSHKMALVTLLQEANLICAMTGDGVNDAPALKKADIGIAMGTGTEVAKSASKMVLADDNFATVVKAVAEGRAIYNNTKQFIRYLISSNIGEVVCILATGLCGIPDALEPVQLLWVNLVTDGLPATALGFNPPDPDIMEQPPRAVDEPIVNRWLLIRYMIVGTYVGLATCGGFFWWFLANGFTMSDLMDYHHCLHVTAAQCETLHHPYVARGIALSILVVVEMFNALNALSENQSLTRLRPTANPWLLLAITSSMSLHFLIMYVPALAKIFEIAPLGVDAATVAAAKPWSVVIPTSFVEWKAVLVFSIPVLFLDELIKFVARRQTRAAKDKTE